MSRRYASNLNLWNAPNPWNPWNLWNLWNLCLLVLVLGASSLHARQRPGYREHVDVTRVVIDARVVDGAWRPLTDLAAEDFAVRIDGRPARVESAHPVVGAGRAVGDGDVGRSDAAPPGGEAPGGRLIVFLFQKSLEPSRLGGFMRLLLEAQTFLDAFTVYDRLAVLSFDSRLQVWLDFTSDLDRVRRVIGRDVLFGRGMPVNSGEPSLLDAISARRARRTYSIEDALVVIGDALQPLPGSKAIVLVGHGFGRLGRGGVTMEPRFAEAGRALLRARAAVFSLDVTNADYHSLEAGLQIVSEETGGLYQRTHVFGGAALNRLAALLAGHYVLLVEKPPLGRGSHRLDVRLEGRRGTVFARSRFED